MNITDFIVELIQKGKKVEIPNMGTLYAEQGAIKFNNETSGDRTAIEAIARKECIDPKIAETMWNNYVGALSDKLQHEGCHEFPGLGTLKCSYGTYGFESGNSIPKTPVEEKSFASATIYTHKDTDEDPFAVFEQPLKPIEEEVMEPEPIPNVEPTPEPVPESAQKTAPEPVHALDAQPAPQPETMVDPEPSPEPTPESEPIPETKQETSPEPKHIPIPESELEPTNTPIQDNLATLKNLENLNQLDTPQKTPSTPTKRQPKEKKKGHGLIWILIILLLLLLSGGAYYYFNCYKTGTSLKSSIATLLGKTETTNSQNDATDSDITPLAESAEEPVNVAEPETNDSEIAGEPQPTSDNVNDERTVTKPETTPEETPQTAANPTSNLDFANTYSQVMNDFTRNTDLIEYSEAEINSYARKVRNFMNGYISDFLAARRYNNARTALLEKIYQYAQKGLIKQLTPENYSVTRFISYNNYMRDIIEDDLHSSKANRACCKIQSELMNREYLDGVLTSLVAEMGLQQDATPAPKKVKTAQPVEPVYNATIVNKSKQGYDVIAGFYTNKTSAQKMAQNLKRQGCDAYIIDKNGLYYVSMGSASTQTAIDATYKHIKSWYHGDASIKRW